METTVEMARVYLLARTPKEAGCRFTALLRMTAPDLARLAGKGNKAAMEELHRRVEVIRERLTLVEASWTAELQEDGTQRVVNSFCGCRGSRDGERRHWRNCPYGAYRPAVRTGRYRSGK